MDHIDYTFVAGPVRDNESQGCPLSPSQSQSTPPAPPATIPKRRRTSKATANQIEALVAKIETQPFLATRRFTGLQGRDSFVSAWKEVAAELNGVPHGTIKTPEQWMTVWRDFKSRACVKASKLNRERAKTGNRSVDAPPLTELEKRVVSVVGTEYTSGTNCPDSMPEENTLQLQMEAGELIEEIIHIPDNYEIEVEQLTAINDEDTAIGNLPIVEESSQITLTGSGAMDSSTRAMVSGSRAMVSGSRATASGRRGTASGRRTVEHVPPRNRNLNPRRSVAEQHSAARADFLAVAESNAESMRMLAAASKMQAEATLLFAQAANKIGDALLELAKKKK